MQIGASTYYNEETWDFQSKLMLDEEEVLALQVNHLIDSIVRVASRVHH